MNHLLRDTRAARLADLYTLLQRASRSGYQTLHGSDPGQHWPQRGIYFFFEPGETRSDSGQGARIVRVGTHALIASSRSTLGGRLNQHRGTISSGSGNHRSSVFRLLVGAALMRRHPELTIESWAKGSHADSEVRQLESTLERAVSDYMRTLTLLVLDVSDEPGPGSLRGYIERNAIALLSNYSGDRVDPPSASWLGHYCPRETVMRSGLWNQNHVQERCDLRFLNAIDQLT